MDIELIVRNNNDSIDVALLRNGRLIELHKILPEDGYFVGDIYLGKVKKTSPSLNAAFIDVGYERDAFLHYLDLGQRYNQLSSFVKSTISGKNSKWSLDKIKALPSIPKDGKIDDLLKKKDDVLVQVSKEPISTKGPRLISEISLAGRYIVLLPFSNRISISQKLKSAKEKDRLKNLIKSIVPKNFGVIVRTVAEGKKVAELDADLTNLINQWKEIQTKLQGAQPLDKIFGGINKLSSILRDILNDSFSKIIVDDLDLYKELKEYLQDHIPQKVRILSKYSGVRPIFEKYYIEKQIKSSFGKTVSMKQGSYLVIEHTEAMHVIDVNSGNRSNKDISQEENALQVNLQAAEEIARQLRLRDMGGIIAVDFIDMHVAENRKKLTASLISHMKDDRAKHKILPPSKFGIVEITRQRVRPVMKIQTVEKMDYKYIEAPILLIDEIKEKYVMLAGKKKRLSQKGIKHITLCAHPFITSYLKQGFPSLKLRWYFKYGLNLKVRANDSYQFLQYNFFDSSNNTITF